MKKLFAVTTLLAHISIAHAQTDLYGGIGAGLDLFTPTRNVDDTITAFPLPFPTVSKKNQDSAVGGDFSAFVGVKQRIEQAAIAAELGGTVSSAKTEADAYHFANNNVTAKALIYNLGNVSLSLLPGFYINNKTEAFLRLGFQRGRFRAQSGGDTGGDLIATGNTTRWLSGYVVGAGMETSLFPCMSARFDYAYSTYQSIRRSSTLPPEVDLSLDQIQSRVTPHDHLVMVSLVFHQPVEGLFSTSV